MVIGDVHWFISFYYYGTENTGVRCQAKLGGSHNFIHLLLLPLLCILAKVKLRHVARFFRLLWGLVYKGFGRGFSFEFLLSSVYLSAMADCQNQNNHVFILNVAQHPIITDSVSPESDPVAF